MASTAGQLECLIGRSLLSSVLVEYAFHPGQLTELTRRKKKKQLLSSRYYLYCCVD